MRDYVIRLRKDMTSAFNLEELEMVVFDVGIDWDELPGRTKTTKTNALIIMLTKQGRLADLIKILRDERPQLHWKDAPSVEQQMSFGQQIRVEVETAFVAMSESVNLMNTIGDEVADYATNSYDALPRQHRRWIEGSDTQLVNKERGQVWQTITADEFGQKLQKEDLEHITVLEKSMKQYYRQWKKLYPQRDSSPSSAQNKEVKQQLNQVVKAISQDLDRILGFLETLGFMLDDHYMRYRDVAHQTRTQ